MCTYLFRVPRVDLYCECSRGQCPWCPRVPRPSPSLLLPAESVPPGAVLSPRVVGLGPLPLKGQHCARRPSFQDVPSRPGPHTGLSCFPFLPPFPTPTGAGAGPPNTALAFEFSSGPAAAPPLGSAWVRVTACLCERLANCAVASLDVQM